MFVGSPRNCFNLFPSNCYIMDIGFEKYTLHYCVYFVFLPYLYFL